MKRFAVLLTLLLLLCFAAEAALELDMDHRQEGMGRSWAQGYAPEEKGNTLSLYYPLKAAQAVGPLRASFKPLELAGSPFQQPVITTNVIPQRGLYPLRFTIGLHADRLNGLYACQIDIEGKDAKGQAIKQSFPLWVDIKGGQPRQEPRPLVLQDVSLTGPLRPGRQASLQLSLQNRSANLALQGIAVTVSDASGDILPVTSDSLYVDQLLPGQTQQLSMPLLSRGSAAATPHQLRLQLSYLDQKGQPVTFSEQHTLMIDHDIRLEHGAPSFPVRVRQGSLNDFSLNLMNMGDGVLKHVLVTLELPGFAPQSVLVGEIPMDESRSAKAALAASTEQLGEVTGRALVTYEDAYGTKGSLEVPVSTVLEEKPVVKPDEPQPEQAKQEPTPLWLEVLPWALAGLAVVAVIVQGVALRGKIRRMEEERL